MVRLQNALHSVLQPSAPQCAPQPATTSVTPSFASRHNPRLHSVLHSPPQLRSHEALHPATTLGHTVRSNSRKWDQEQGSQVKVTKLCQAETVWNY